MSEFNQLTSFLAGVISYPSTTTTSFLFFCCFSLSSKHKNIFGLLYILGPLFQKFLLLFFFSETFLFLWGKKGREKSHQNVLMTIKPWLSSKELFLTYKVYVCTHLILVITANTRNTCSLRSFCLSSSFSCSCLARNSLSSSSCLRARATWYCAWLSKSEHCLEGSQFREIWMQLVYFLFKTQSITLFTHI